MRDDRHGTLDPVVVVQEPARRRGHDDDGRAQPRDPSHGIPHPDRRSRQHRVQGRHRGHAKAFEEPREMVGVRRSVVAAVEPELMLNAHDVRAPPHGERRRLPVARGIVLPDPRDQRGVVLAQRSGLIDRQNAGRGRGVARLDRVAKVLGERGDAAPSGDPRTEERDAQPPPSSIHSSRLPGHARLPRAMRSTRLGIGSRPAHDELVIGFRTIERAIAHQATHHSHRLTAMSGSARDR